MAVVDKHALDPAGYGWLREAGLRAIFAAVQAARGEARAVGGAVRNSLLGLPVADVDLAVSLPPEQAEAALAAAGIKSVRTGFAHGTITAVVDHRGYEMTSLRRDVATDGRHAVVAYTDVWEEDAARRDFTFNALYVDAAGKIYDFHHGIDDLHAGRVRFIGDTGARIAEDYLRILRFFRFHAAYGKDEVDAVALAACVAGAPLLGHLSRERVTQEFKKLLLTRDPVPVLTLMRTHDILAQILPLDMRIERLAALLPLDQGVGFAARLAVMLPSDTMLEPVLRTVLRLSVAELREVQELYDPARAVRAELLPRALYRWGQDYCRTRILCQMAAGEVFDLDAVTAQIAAWRRPVFPLTGEAMLALGIAPSLRFGEILRAVEDWWITGGFKDSKAACLAEARRRAGI